MECTAIERTMSLLRNCLIYKILNRIRKTRDSLKIHGVSQTKHYRDILPFNVWETKVIEMITILRGVF